MRQMVLITADFPYGVGENFLETEIDYYTEFDQVHIYPLGCCAGKMRAVPSNVIVHKKRKETKIASNGYSWEIVREIWDCAKRRGWYKIYGEMHLYRQVTDYYNRAYLETERIGNSLKQEGVKAEDNIVIYSYWMHLQAIVAALLKRKYPNAKLVTRCHRYDLYEESDKNQYQPFRKLIFETFDLIAPISSDGQRYLRERYRSIRSKMRVYRLGVKNDLTNLTANSWWGQNDMLKIVSSSNLVPVKRVERIIEALSLIYDIPIEWKHFGDGSEEKKLKGLCEKNLSSHDNIKWQFMGRVINREMLDYYAQERPHVLINVSESEGLPVSMMEAMSYGIPVIGTDVGGVKEIIVDRENGYLLKADDDGRAIANAIRSFYHQSEQEYMAMSQSARKMYDKRYNADVNYRRFVSALLRE